LVCIGLWTGSAQALTVTNWGTHDDPTEFGFNTFAGGSGSFNYVYRFSLGQTYDALAVAVSNDSTPTTKLNIDGGKVELFLETSADGDFSNDVSLGLFAFDSTAAHNNFLALAADLYYYAVTAMVLGPKGGSYGATVSLRRFRRCQYQRPCRSFRLVLVALGLGR
jgi:hypothetical protein